MSAPKPTDAERRKNLDEAMDGIAPRSEAPKDKAGRPYAVQISECGPTCPPMDEKWAIPGGVLNGLWSHVFPRMVAWAWRNGHDLKGNHAHFENMLTMFTVAAAGSGTSTFQN